MLTALALVVLSQDPSWCYRTARAGHECSRASNRSGANFAFFEAFNGTGTTTACSTTAPTGAKGEALTFSRASNGTCTKGTDGLRTTAIADGDLVVLSSNVARVEANSLGELWLLVESAHTNTCLRSAEICNAAWADVGTPNCASDAQPGPFGTTTMDQLNDNTDLSQEGRSQAITTTSATRHTVSCYVKAGTATEATITLRGTGNAAGDCTGTATALSTSTSKRITCTSAAAYTAALTSVTVSILVGDAAEDTGSIYVEGCDHVVSSAYLLSHIPTTSAAATMAMDSPNFVVAATGPTASIAASVQWPSSEVGAVNIAALGSLAGANMTVYRTSNTAAGYQINAVTTAPAVAAMAAAIHRTALFDNSGTRGAFWDSASVAAPAASMGSTQTDVWIGRNVSGTPVNGLVGRVCVDPDPTRCR